MNIKICVGVVAMSLVIWGVYSNFPVRADVVAGEKLSDDAEILTEEEALESETNSIDGCEDEGERVLSLNQAQVKLVGRLAKGMRAIIRKRDRGNWYFCGEPLDSVKQEEVSTAIAYHAVLNRQSVGLESVSPWGIIATAYNESGLDACALGLFPRRWGYKKGLLVRRRDPNTNVKMRSHTREEVLAFISTPQAKRRYSESGFDLGFCQVLSRFYRGQEEDALTTDKGMRMCVLEMQARSQKNKTTIPWLFWKGVSETNWYRDKIRRWAKMMGASNREMKKI